MSCKVENEMIMMDDVDHGHLIKTNSEHPGTDCVVISSHNAWLKFYLINV